MSNLSRIQANNDNLDVCIAKANALPDASGGGSGSVEAWRGTVMYDAPGGFAMSPTIIHYTDGNLSAQALEASEGNSVSIEVVKNSIVVCEGLTDGEVNCENIGSGACLIKADNFIISVS